MADYTAQTWADGSGGATPLSATRLGVMETGVAGRAQKLTPTASKTGAYTAVDGDMVVCNATSGAFTVTMPTATAGALVAVKKTDATANTVTVSGTFVSGQTVNPVARYQDHGFQFLGTASGWVLVNTLTGRMSNAAEGHARYYQSSAQTIAASVVTKLTFPNSVSTTADVTVAGNNTFTLVPAGVWLIEAGVAYASVVDTTYRDVFIADGSTSTTVYSDNSAPNPSGGINLVVSTCRRFAAAATVSAYAYHESGSSLNTAPSSEKIHISLTYLRP